MPGTIFIETLRRTWRSTLLWAVGIASLGILAVVIIPSSETLQTYGEVLKSMPPALINLFGGGDAQFLTSPDGYLSVAFFGRILLILSVYGVVAGLNVTANDEDRGLMDIVLALPVPRWRVILEKTLAYMINLTVIVLISYIGLQITISSNGVFTTTPQRLLESILNVVPAAIFVLLLTVFCGVVFRRRTTALAVAAAIIVISYFATAIGVSASAADILRRLSFYSYYDPTAVLQNGTQIGNIFGLLGAGLILLIGSVVIYQRRDVGV